MSKNRLDHNFFDKMTKDFVINEREVPLPTILSYIQSLSETLTNMTPRTQTEARRLSVAKIHLKEVRKMAKKLQERVQVLEEQVNILEEEKGGRN